jgi:hypothetical protein
MELDQELGPVKTKALLVDPESMTAVWMNEAASQDLGGESGVGLPLAQAMPLAEKLGVLASAAQVAEDGVAQHLRTGLLSTSRGSLEIVCSVYRLPDGNLLVLVDTDMKLKGADRAGGSRRR